MLCIFEPGLYCLKLLTMSFFQPKLFCGTFEKHFTAYICGQKGSGKSDFLLSCIIRKNGLMDNYDRIIVFTHLQNKIHYSRAIEPQFIHCFEDSEVEKMFLQFEQTASKMISEERRVPSCLWVFDDRLTDRTRYSKTLQILYCRGRHLNSSCVFISQSLNGLSAVARRNLDYFCLVSSPCLLYVDRKSIQQNFLGMLPKIHANHIIDNLHAYETLIINQRCGRRPNGWRDRIFTYIVPEILRNWDSFHGPLSQKSNKHVKKTFRRESKSGGPIATPFETTHAICKGIYEGKAGASDPLPERPVTVGTGLYQEHAGSV